MFQDLRYGLRMLLKHVIALPLAEGTVHSGEGELDDLSAFIKKKRTERR